MLKFYCSNVANCDEPFDDNAEVLLSISMIAECEDLTNKVKFCPENQSGSGFLEIVHTITNNPKIEKVTLFDTAYLQRHRKILDLFSFSNNEKNYTEQLAEKYALEDSSTWKNHEHHKYGISLLENKFKDKFTILTWVDTLLDVNFRSRLSKVNNLYYSDSTVDGKKFRYAVNRLIDIFFNKLSQNIKNKIRSNELSIKFVRDQLTNIALEESAVRSLLNYQYEIYRGPINIPAKIVYEKFGTNGKMQLVSIGNSTEVAYYKKVYSTASNERNFEKRVSKLMNNKDSNLVDVQVLKFKVPAQELIGLLKYIDSDVDSKQMECVKLETDKSFNNEVIKNTLMIKGKKCIRIVSIYNDDD